MRKIVVVGASLAGLRTAQALRKRGFDGELELVGDEPHAPYDRPPLSKQLLSGDWPAERLFFSAKENHAALGLTQSLGRRARSLDLRERKILLDDGSTRDFDGLVIATGASARRLPAQEGWSNAFTLRTLDDALAIRSHLLQSPRVLVVGAGFIGLEVAASCRKLNLAVTVVEPQALPLLGLLGPRVGAAVRELHAAHGVELRLGVTLNGFEGHGGRVERALLSDGTHLETDLVVVGIGVVPETRWLEGSGLELASGVVCDASCATRAAGVVAAGDVARWPHAWYGELLRIEHWSNAVEQADAAAARLLDAAAPDYTPLPYFWSDQYDVKLQFAGRVEPQDELVEAHGKLGEDKAYLVLFGRQGRLSGVLASNRPAQFIRCRKALSERASLHDARAALS
jgi:3-phenylpropionate/trans-cinnamate dioxygenase ferredoxin reductase component